MSSSDVCNVDGASKSNDDGLCEVNDMLQNMSTSNNDINMSVCANCGKEGANNTCNKCNQVMYCNAACKKKHRTKHKKQCERKVAELHDEQLFKQPPPPHEDCPICFLLLPSHDYGKRYKSCCGKVICSGCIHAPVYDHHGNIVGRNIKCPFCRSPTPTSEDLVERLKKRMEAGDSIAIDNIAMYYRDGIWGFKQNYSKSLELYHRAGDLGYTAAYCNVGEAYEHGRGGVEVDLKKAIHYYELGAMGGDIKARHRLGFIEGRTGNFKRAIKHFIIATSAGYKDSLEKVKSMYSFGLATKEDYAKALQLYQAYLNEIKSSQRDEAAAACEDYRYY